MNQTTRPKRPFGLGVYLLLIAGALVLGAAVGVVGVLLTDAPGSLGFIITFAITTVAMLGGLAGCVWWWRGIDEAAQEAHKWAWWWGGTTGTAIGGALLLTLTQRADTTPIPGFLGSNPADLLASGMMSILVFQLIGYSLGWAVWWLKHR